jgi:hypothetical protein
LRVRPESVRGDGTNAMMWIGMTVGGMVAV